MPPSASAPSPAATARSLLLWPLQASVVGAVVVLTLADGLLRMLDASMNPEMLEPWIVARIVTAVLVLLGTLAMLVQFSTEVFYRSAMGEPRVRLLGFFDLVPFTAPVTVRLALIALLVAVLLVPLTQRAPPGVQVAVVLVGAAVLPAMATLLILNGSLADALDPRKVLALTRAMGGWYAGQLLVGAALLTAVAAPARTSWSWPLGTLAIGYVWFLGVHALGRIVHHCRLRIGLDVAVAPEHAEARRADQLRKRHARMLERAYRRSATSVDAALATIETYLNEDQHDIDTRRWLFERLQTWADPATAVWFANDLIVRLLRLGRGDEALSAAHWCLSRNPAFRPRGAEATFELADLARRNGRHRLCTALLSDFAERFPDSVHAAPSQFLLARVALEKTDQRELARAAIARLGRWSHTRDDPRLAALNELAGE